MVESAHCQPLEERTHITAFRWAEVTARQVLLEMKKCDLEAGRLDHAVAMLIVDLARAFGQVRQCVIWPWATYLGCFPHRTLMFCVGVLRTKGGRSSSLHGRRFSDSQGHVARIKLVSFG